MNFTQQKHISLVYDTEVVCRGGDIQRSY